MVAHDGRTTKSTARGSSRCRRRFEVTTLHNGTHTATRGSQRHSGVKPYSLPAEGRRFRCGSETATGSDCPDVRALSASAPCPPLRRPYVAAAQRGKLRHYEELFHHMKPSRSPDFYWRVALWSSLTLIIVFYRLGAAVNVSWGNTAIPISQVVGSIAWNNVLQIDTRDDWHLAFIAAACCALFYTWASSWRTRLPRWSSDWFVLSS